MKKKQLFLNIIANFLSLSISLIISFFLTPYIISSIGKEAFSFIPIANNFTAYMSILTIALTSMTARFVTINICKSDMDSANNYYSTSFFINLIMATMIALVCFVVIIFLDRLINIPVEILSDVRVLFIIMFVTFILNISTSVFSVKAFSMNRLDITSIISISGTIAKVIIIFIAFKYLRPKIYYLGVASFVVVFIHFIMNFLIGRKILPTLIISIKNVKSKIIKELFFSGIWNSFNQLSVVLLTGLDLVIANIVLGASPAGILAIAKTAPLALQSLIEVVPSAFNPYLTILYAKESKEKFFTELQFILKISAILIGIPIAGFIALSSNFYSLWMPSVDNNQLTILSILTMVSLGASFSIMPLFYIFTITNKLKWPSVAVFVSGVINISVVLLFAYYSNFGIYAIAGVSSILEIFRCLVFVPMYAAKCLNKKLNIFYPFIVKSILYIIILVVLFLTIESCIMISNWKILIISAGGMSTTGLIFGLLFILNSTEKAKFKKYIVRLIS